MQCSHKLRQQLADVERFRLDLHVASFDLGQVKHVIDQLQQIMTGPMHDIGVANLLLGQVARRVLSQLIAQDENTVERRAQLVRHVGEELGFVPVGGHQLICLIP